MRIYVPGAMPTARKDLVQFGRIILRNGKTAMVGAAQLEDRKAVRDFFECLSPESRRQRFGSTALPSPGLVTTLCDNSDPHSALTLVVSRRGFFGPHIIAVGSYVARDGTTAEVALAVADAFQGQGIGTFLLKRLARLAARYGFVHLCALTETDNRSMQRILRTSGYSIQERLQGTQIELDLAVGTGKPTISRWRM